MIYFQKRKSNFNVKNSHLKKIYNKQNYYSPHKDKIKIIVFKSRLKIYKHF